MDQVGTLQAIAAQAQALVNAETAVLALAETEGSQVYYAAAVGVHAAAIAGRRGPAAAAGLCGTTFEAGEAVLVCSARGDSRVRQDQVEMLGITTALSVPIFYEGILLGAIMVLNRADGSTFDQLAEQALNAYAQEVAMGVYRYLTAKFE